jgi:hypothetical protein
VTLPIILLSLRFLVLAKLKGIILKFQATTSAPQGNHGLVMSCPLFIETLAKPPFSRFFKKFLVKIL